MSKYTAQERLKIINKVTEGKKPVSRVCQEAGISRTLFYRWLSRYQKAKKGEEKEALFPKNRKIYFAKGQISPKIEKEILVIVCNQPHLSSKQISRKLGKDKTSLAFIGNHGVQNVLKRLNLNTYEKRLAFSQRRSKLPPLFRKRMLEWVIEGKKPVAYVCREYGLSRTAFYRWLRTYQESGKSLSSLWDKIPKVDQYWRQLSAEQVEKILGIVRQHPEYSTHKVAQALATVGNHGVQNAFKRLNLNTYERRLAYVQSVAPVTTVSPVTGWVGRIRSVFETFVPQLAPAPPPQVKELAKPFLATLFLTSFSSYLFLLWLQLLSRYAPSQQIGLILATFSLIIGGFFFIYSMKYYFTLALVLSFSRQPQEEAVPTGRQGGGYALSLSAKVNGNGNGNGKLAGWLKKIFGINGNGNGNGNSNGLTLHNIEEGSGGSISSATAGGLQPNLDHINIKRYPFISIHLPFYNEKKVAERILKACSTIDYPNNGNSNVQPNFEIVVCDDSTDETVEIIADYLASLGKVTKYQGDNGEVISVVRPPGKPTIKVIHRTTREGFKGGALSYALRHMDSKTEFVCIFDADFIPYPDTLKQFVKYFKATGGWDEKKNYQTAQIETMSYDTFQNIPFSKQQQRLLDKQAEDLKNKSHIAVVAGYQWHVLNKSENWITRGVRTEYAGSYVIERPGQEILGALKIIHGSVYCIRADVLKHFGWGTSITEDYELTLRIYEKGFRVVYTPYIQAPSECVATIKRLIRQRMRWAEGHSFNTKKQFLKLLFSPHLTLMEKLEFLYLAPYYLQAAFFMVGTFCWLLAETVFRARLPFWTSLWGWSLVLTNFFALPLLNSVGLFLEEAEEKDYLGILSFIALCYLVVPFQAYAAIKGFIEKQEGPWFRTPKTGRITDIFARGKFYRWLLGILPGKKSEIVPAPVTAKTPFTQTVGLDLNPYLALATANNQFENFRIGRKNSKLIGRSFLVMIALASLTLSYLSWFVPSKNMAAPIFAFSDLAGSGGTNNKSSEQKIIGPEDSRIENESSQITNEPTFYIDLNDGVPKEIDLKLADSQRKDLLTGKGFKKEVIKNNFKTYFKEDVSEENYLEISKQVKQDEIIEESKLIFSLMPDQISSASGFNLGQNQGNRYLYPEIYPGVDLEYQVGANRLSESYILKSKETIGQGRYFGGILKMERLFYEEYPDNSLRFFSKLTGDPVFTIPAPVMFEKNHPEVKSTDLHYQIEEIDNQIFLAKIIDPPGLAWLKDEGRQYPVVIDPTVDVTTNISSNAMENSVQRKTFYDSVNGKYWAGVRKGTAGTNSYIYFYYSADGSSWTYAGDDSRGGDNDVDSGDSSWAIYPSVESGTTYVYLSYANGVLSRVDIDKGTVGSTSITWSKGSADCGGTHRYANIARSGSGYVWVTIREWNDSTSTYNLYAVRSSNTYSVAAFDGCTNVNNNFNLFKNAIHPDSSGANMMLTYHGANYTDIMYATYTGSWTDQGIFASSTKQNPDYSVAVDSNYDIHVVYIDGSDEVQYMKWTTSWSGTTALTSSTTSTDCSIAIDSNNGDIYAVYQRSSTFYYKKYSGSWGGETNTNFTEGTTPAAISTNHSRHNTAGDSGRIFAIWTYYTGSQYNVAFDFIFIPEKIWLFLGLGLLIPKLLKKQRRKKEFDPIRSEEEVDDRTGNHDRMKKRQV